MNVSLEIAVSAALPLDLQGIFLSVERETSEQGRCLLGFVYSVRRPYDLFSTRLGADRKISLQ